MSLHTVKLQNAFVPTAYDVRTRVDLSTWSYEAHETVTLTRCAAVPYSDTIQLHAAPTMELLAVEGATLLKRDAAAHTLHLKLDDAPAAEKADAAKLVLHFHFKHVIQSELRGFYRVRFHHDGAEHRMASTHFEPTSARLFYICHDEPAQRADFTLSVTLPASCAHYTVLSNGPLKRKTTEPATGDVTHVFDTILRCPPYLTACVVGELECVAATHRGTVPVRVFTTPGKSQRAQFALKIVLFALDHFEKFFRCNFPLPKLDVVAVPDFPIGGMENWGCITCVESILVDEASSSVNALKRTSELVCHEVSHNWFGNLVAINWWEGLWLKEGLASWCGNTATHAFEPSWNCLAFAAASVSEAMDIDMHANSHPVEVPIRDPADITQAFDSISYDKGMGLVFMLQHFLGQEKWGAAAAHYINKYRYKDTTTVQLWQALEESSQLPVTEVMTSFTTQMGYPILHVRRVSPTVLSLQQQPCQLAIHAAPRDGKPPTWCVPVTICGLDRDAADELRVSLRGATAVNVTLPDGLAASGWLTCNPRRYGFYRCRYDDALFEAWISNFAVLAEEDRCAFIADTFAGLRAGFDDVERVVRVMQVVCTHEHDLSVLEAFYSEIQVFLATFRDTGVAADAELSREVKSVMLRALSFIVTRAEAAVRRRAETDAQKLLDAFYIRTALRLLVMAAEEAQRKASPLLPWATAQAEAFLSDGDYAMATLMACLQFYLRSSPDATTAAERGARLYRRLAEVDGDDERSRAVIAALCVGPDTNLAFDVTTRSMHNDQVRSQYGGIAFAGLADNCALAPGELWRFFKEHYEAVAAQWGGGQFRIQGIVSLVGGTLSGADAAREFAHFFTTHPLPNARLAIGRAAEDIELRGWLRDKWRHHIVDILRRHLAK